MVLYHTIRTELILVLTNDVKHFPDRREGSIALGNVEINAPAFCDRGASDRSNGTKLCTRDDVLKAISSRPLAFEPWTRPLYSNTGFNLLGWAVAQAVEHETAVLLDAVLGENSASSLTLEKLLQKDVFEPIGMNNSSFWVPLEKRDNVAVPGKGVPSMIDWDFTSTFNPYQISLHWTNIYPVQEECTQLQMISQNSSIKSSYPQILPYCQTNRFENGYHLYTSSTIVILPWGNHLPAYLSDVECHGRYHFPQT
jgi:hypothetical protein